MTGCSSARTAPSRAVAPDAWTRGSRPGSGVACEGPERPAVGVCAGCTPRGAMSVPCAGVPPRCRCIRGCASNPTTGGVHRSVRDPANADRVATPGLAAPGRRAAGARASSPPGTWSRACGAGPGGARPSTSRGNRAAGMRFVSGRALCARPLTGTVSCAGEGAADTGSAAASASPPASRNRAFSMATVDPHGTASVRSTATRLTSSGAATEGEPSRDRCTCNANW